MLGIGLQQKTSNEDIRQRFDRTETIMDIIRHRKLLIFGYICRMPDDRLVKTVLLGLVDGVRQRGRPPKRRTDKITEWTELTLCEAVRLSQHRVTWSRIVFGSYSHLTKGQEEEEEVPQCATATEEL